MREPGVRYGKVDSVEPPSDDAESVGLSLVDPSAFAPIYDRHAAVLLGYLVRRVGFADAESLLGELFRIAFESRDRYDRSRPDARPWLYGIAANLVMKHFRAAGRRDRAIERLGARRECRPLALEDQVVDSAATSLVWSRVAEAVAGLPERDREVMFLYAWQEMSYVDISQALGIPIGTVRSRLNRVRTTLRELVADDGEEPDTTTQRTGKGDNR
ncbi:MAG: sigma-70 family RNA polymerase sigma factor [Sulfitobacter sp.]|nr:sigma-70 family RNA polymerase sigma factor [Sulfitobacter sp.]MCP3934405.1 sigma-70 family RNA polymerase sigma factor [Actinomycetes bacterium]MCP4087257.1 sigma-70 family RNA polymerase sigma factor [Actinomycetes bacterium]